MAHRKKSKRTKAKTILRLPDLEQSKIAVLHSLAAPSSQESYRFFLEQKNLAPSTINVRLAAVRRGLNWPQASVVSKAQSDLAFALATG